MGCGRGGCCACAGGFQFHTERQTSFCFEDIIDAAKLQTELTLINTDVQQLSFQFDALKTAGKLKDAELVFLAGKAAFLFSVFRCKHTHTTTVVKMSRAESCSVS